MKDSLPMTVLKAGAVVTSIALAGFLIVQEQRRVNPVPLPRDAKEPPPTPASAEGQRFVYDSKNFVVDPLVQSDPGETSPDASGDSGGAPFLSTSKSLQFHGDDSPVTTVTPFLGSSKSSVVIELPEVDLSGPPSEGPRAATPGTFLPSSKSLTILDQFPAVSENPFLPTSKSAPIVFPELTEKGAKPSGDPKDPKDAKPEKPEKKDSGGQ